jgi:hypothetical protein
VNHESSLGFAYTLDNNNVNVEATSNIVINDNTPLKRPKITPTVLNGKLKSGHYLAEFLKQKRIKSRISLEIGA